MRALFTCVVALMVGLSSEIGAQTPRLEIQAGVGYARAFDGGGLSFVAALERPLSAPTSRAQHALGASLWHSRMSLGSAPTSSLDRHLTGLGIRYQLELRTCCGHARPFFAVPIQVLRSNIPDRATLQGANLSITGVPDPGLPTPIEDRMGAEWGWGTGAEVGFRVGVSGQLSAQTSVQGLYHQIYESGTRNYAWSWHAGLSYGLRNK
jgi:hypothetical protein